MRLLAIQRVLGAVLAMTGAIMLPPIAIAVALDEPTTTAFVESLLGCAVTGLVLWLPARGRRHELRVRDGFLVTTLVWVMVCIACALPFMLAPPHLSFVDALFESTSGLTTTGATVIVGLDALPRSVLFYRQSLCFLGGMGIVILAVAVLPMLRIGGSQLFRTEATGPQKESRLTPRIAETARALWSVYLGLNVLCALAFWAGGMSLFDAVGHAFSTVATGGFSTHDASLGHFDSPLIEMIAVVFMFLGGVSFAVHWSAWHRASAAPYFHDPELKAYLGIALGLTAVVAAGAYAAGAFESLGMAWRHALFQTVSNLTTTGYTTTGFVSWGSFAPLLLILAGFVGGCSGSTSGGVKVARVVMLMRQGGREVLQLVHPRGRFMVKLGSLSVPGAVLAAVSGFCTLYLLSYVVIALAVSATGVEPITAWSAAAACINNMGPGLGDVAVHMGGLNDAAVVLLSFAMLLGRLEVFTVLVLLTPAFWRE